MDLSRVIAISVKPGLYRLISQTRGGFVVEDLEKGSQSCYQALSIFKILDQPKMEKKFRGILKIILRNQKDPNSSAVFL